MGWKSRAVTKSRGVQVVLETMRKEGEPDYWIVPKKLSVNAMQRITQAVDLDVELSEEEKQGKSPEQLEELLVEKISKQKNRKTLFTPETIEMIKVAFLEGVEDHNFDDEAGNKIPWDENFFEEMKNYPDTLLEIFRAVMRFHYPLAQTKSGKSGT